MFLLSFLTKVGYIYFLIKTKYGNDFNCNLNFISLDYGHATNADISVWKLVYVKTLYALEK